MWLLATRASVSEGGAQSGAMSRDNTVTHYGQNCFRHSCNKDETKNVSDISMWMKRIKLGQDLPHDESLPHCNNYCELRILLFMAHCIFFTNCWSRNWIWILAPPGAQGMLMSVCPSVCSAQSALEQSIFIILGQRAVREQSESNQRAVKALQ